MLMQLEPLGRPPDCDKQWSTVADTCVRTGKLNLTLFDAVVNKWNRK